MTTENARGLWVGVAAMCAVTGIGFFTGIRGSAKESAAAAQRPPAPSTTVSARNYADMRERRFGPNADMYEGAFAKLAPPVSSQDKVPPQTLADKIAALAARAKRRAYDGAPPVVPHAIAQFDAPACLTCHATGAKIGDKIAPRISHPAYTSCVQCHAAGADPRPGGTPTKVAANTFVGLPSPSAGKRAEAKAPPTIPHSTWMRDQCASCHGPTGLMGMRTTHPWRQQCVQCHAAAVTDSHPTKKLAPLGWSAPQ